MRTYFRIVKALFYLTVLLPPTILLKKIRFPGYKIWPHWVHGNLCRALNIRIMTEGRPHEGATTLFVSNHVSWVDILVLGKVIKGACFIAKQEMSGWPVLGYLAGLQRTIFIDRGRRSDAVNQKQELHDRMKEGDNLILFPEGTTSDGARVLPFKSALFGVTEKVMHLHVDEQGHVDELMVQPVTIVYRRINNMPVNRNSLFKVAWIGDMDLGPHLWSFLRLLKVEVEVHFHKPVSRNLFKTRKELATYCHRTVEKRLQDCLRGRRAELSRVTKVDS